MTKPEPLMGPWPCEGCEPTAWFETAAEFRAHRLESDDKAHDDYEWSVAVQGGTDQLWAAWSGNCGHCGCSVCTCTAADPCECAHIHAEVGITTAPSPSHPLGSVTT